MARTKFHVEVLTPEGEVFNDEVEMLSTRTSVGSIGVLANHTPLLGMLDPAELRLYRSETDIVRLADTIRGFKEILEGKHDDLPEQAFYMVGTIDDAIAKAKKLAA